MVFLAVIFALLLLSLMALVVFGERRWRAGTAAVVTRLRGLAVASPAPAFSLSQLEGLPTPVASYFRSVLREGQPLIRSARLKQDGRFLVQPGENRWAAFHATEDMVAQPGGFVWDAHIRMAPGLTVRVRDASVEGEGSMVGALMGLKTVIRAEHTPEIAAGALLRYLAEAVWAPTALLPAAGVVWTPIDGSAARATLTVGRTTVSLDFHFGADTLVRSVYTAARAREVNGQFVLTPWQGRWFTYEEHAGMRIPVDGEVEWLLPEKPQVYWRGRITSVTYDFRAQV